MASTSDLTSTNSSKKRSSVSETGNAKNVSNFNLLIQFIIGFGTQYNPTKAKLQLANMQAKHTSCDAKLNNVITDNTAFNNRVNERIIEFSDVNPLSTRLINALEATDASPEKVNNAKTFNRKIQGKRANTSTPPSGVGGLIDPNTPASTTISTSQQSYGQKIQHFAGILSVIETEPTYAPNETDLTIVTVTTKKANLISRNNAVTTAYATISNTRLLRDKDLYEDETGMVDIALESKKYIKSVFGATSPEYNQIKGIEFKKPKKK